LRCGERACAISPHAEFSFTNNLQICYKSPRIVKDLKMSIRISLLLVAFLFCTFAIWVSPEHLIPLGIMDISLMSENELTRKTALLEISIAKYGACVVAVLCAVLSAFWPVVQHTKAFQYLVCHDLRYPAAYEFGIRQVFDKSFAVILILLFASLAYVAVAEKYFLPATLAAINREDGAIEYASAGLLLIAAFYAFYVGLFAVSHAASRRVHLFLAVLFVVMCGEEISWGQRILGLETPEGLAKLNAQKETNLHNMFGYLFDHLFILCFFLWGCVVPLLYHISRTCRQLLRWTGIPIPSVGLSIGMMLITLFQSQIVLAVLEPVHGLRLPELRELLSATAFLAIMRQSCRGLTKNTDVERVSKVKLRPIE
jgi:hypothetical protein